MKTLNMCVQRPHPGPGHVAAQAWPSWASASGPKRPSWTDLLGLRRAAQVPPEEVGDDPPECRRLIILGKSRNVRRSGFLPGINDSTH